MLQLPVIEVSYPSLSYYGMQYAEPVLALVANIFGLGPESPALLCLELGILLAGSYLFLCQRQLSKISALFGAVLVALSSLFVLGADVVAHAVCWYPMLCFSITLAVNPARRARLGELTLLGVVGVIWLVSSGPFVVFGLLTAFAVSMSAYKREPVIDGGYFQIISATLYFFLLVGLAMLLLPPSVGGAYPDGATIAPLSPLSYLPAPLLGPSPGPNMISFQPFQDELYSRSLRAVVILVLVALGMLSRRLRGDSHYLAAFCGSCLVVGVVAGDLRYEILTTSLSPYQFLRRFVPGVALRPLPWMLLPFLIVSVAPAIVSKFSIRALAFGSLALLAMHLLVLPIGRGKQLGFSPGAHRFVTGFEEAHHGKASTLVRKVFGDWVVEGHDRGEWARGDFEQLSVGRDYNVRVVSSPNGDKASAAVDGDLKTRWHTGRPQRAGDQFEAYFDRAISVSKVVLSVASAPTDFPRGFRVEGMVDSATFTELVSFPEWLGPIRWTSDGLPYFGPQAEVELLLRDEKPLYAIRVTLTRDAEPFDWTVSELQLWRRVARMAR